MMFWFAIFRVRRVGVWVAWVANISLIPVFHEGIAKQESTVMVY